MASHVQKCGKKSTLKEQSELWFDVLNWAQEQYQFNHNVSSLIYVVVFDHHYLLSASSHLKFFYFNYK